MRIVTHTQVPDCREQWNALAAQVERPQVFYTYEWAQAVLRAYGDSVKPLILTAHREDRLVGAVALAQDAASGRVSFLAGSTADYCDFISASEDRKKFVLLALQELRRNGVRQISFANLPADSASAPVLQSHARESGFSIFSRPAYVCAQVSLDSNEKRIHVRKSARNKLRRFVNSAGDRDFVVRHHSDFVEVDREFGEFTIAHLQRFLTSGRVSNLVRSERRMFLIELARQLSASGWLALSTLQCGGRSIAWNYGFRYAGNWFWYQPAFDIEMAQLSPGSYLLCEILRQAAEDPEIQNVDLGLGDEGYKQRYSKSGRQTLHITASSPAGKVLGVVRYRCAELVKRSARVEQGVRALVAKATQVQQTVASAGTAKAIAHYASRAAKTLIGAREVTFFEYTKSRRSPTALNLQPLSTRLLARAAMEHENDAQTLRYFLRSAERLNSGNVSGFALTTGSGTPVHFCSVSPYEGFFLSELQQLLKEPAPDSVMIFDCYTPLSRRGNGYYGACIAEVANVLLAQGKRPWIFSAAGNASSLRGIEKSGFVPRFSLTSRRKFFFATVSSSDLKASSPSQFDLYPAA
jgi:CelD/BcsL family acetyltransferase involved in cellulose biosynthesis